MDRAVPLLERCARGEVKMEYRLLAAQITEPGETVLNARALGLPLGLMMGTHDPEVDSIASLLLLHAHLVTRR
jgi:hypothetical protein